MKIDIQSKCRPNRLGLSFAAVVLVIACGNAQFTPAQQQNQFPPLNNGFNGGLPERPPVVTDNGPAARIASVPNQPGDEVSSATAETEAATGTIPTRSLLQIFRDGGVMMYPIALCSFVLLIFVFERAIYLRRGRVIPKPFVLRALEVLEQQQVDREEAIALCEENGSPIARLFMAAAKKWGRPAVEVEQAVLDEGERISNNLRRYLRLMNAISNVGPLLGLLGTVSGMIETFNTIAGSDAMGRPEMLASGIGQALLTTAAGLLVAIPAYLLYMFFLGRVDRLIIEMDQLAQEVVDYVSAEGLQEASRARRSRAKAA